MTVEDLMALGPDELAREAGLAVMASEDLKPEEDKLQLGPEYDPIEIGRRILQRIERQFYRLVCSDDRAEEKDRTSIKAAAGFGNVTLAGTLITILTGPLHVQHSIAIVAAAFLVKYVFNPAGDELCEFWQERLSHF
jgi:hypothetical protein